MKRFFSTLIALCAIAVSAFSQPCTENEVLVNMTTGAFGDEVNFSISDENGLTYLDLQSILGTTASSNTTYEFNLCLPDGCYTISTTDSFGDGWNGGVLTLSVDSSMYAYGLPSGSFGSYAFGINTEGCFTAVYGCTDPGALNYNNAANVDDGSCTYPIECENGGDLVQLYVCTFGSGECVQLDIYNLNDSSLVYSVAGLSNSEIFYTDLCLPSDGCFMAQMSNGCGQTGWYGGYFWINNGNAQLVNNYLDSNLSNEEVYFSTGGGCPIPGCTDPEALNYNPQANLDNGSCLYPEPCDLNSMQIVMNVGGFGSETSWMLVDENEVVVANGFGYSSNSIVSSSVCLPDGCYTLQMFDTFGDGWNGGSITLFYNGQYVIGELPAGNFGQVLVNINSTGECVPAPVYGCTDPYAENYNVNATADDGSCTYPFACESGVAASMYVCTFSNGFAVEFDIVDESGAVVASVSGLGNGAIEYFDICLDPEQCYQVNMSNSIGANGWYGGYFWINAGNVQVINESLNSASSEETAYFSVNGTCPVYGCTDAEALNYNPEAEIDNGTCTYPLVCNDGTYVSGTLQTGSFPSEISWSIIGPDSTYYYGNANYPSGGNIEMCLADGCYTLELFDSFGDGWNFGVLNLNLPNGTASFGMETGSYAVYVFGIGDVTCEEPTIYGCIDPEATNYNAYANTDDGSCVYPFSCDSGMVANLYICTFSNGNAVSLSLADNEGNVVYQSSVLGNGAIFNTSICLDPDMCYTANMSNTAGQTGWSNGYFWINTGGIQIINESLDSNLNFESVNFSINGTCAQVGCTDPTASNYNPFATEDDGSCEYDVPCTDNQVSIIIGTGMWPSEMQWNVVDASGDVVLNGGPYTATNTTLSFNECLADGCYTLQMIDTFGDGWNNGAIFIIADSVSVVSGQLPSGNYAEIQFGINNDCSGVVLGCTNEVALNYNPEATEDDGSCVFGFGDSEDFILSSLTGFDPSVEFIMMPNPHTGKGSLRINVKELAVEQVATTLEMYDALGRLVTSGSIGSLTKNAMVDVALPELESGIYFVRLTNGGYSSTERLVVE